MYKRLKVVCNAVAIGRLVDCAKFQSMFDKTAIITEVNKLPSITLISVEFVIMITQQLNGSTFMLLTHMKNVMGFNWVYQINWRQM